MLSSASLARLNFGYFVRPAGETGDARVVPALGYLLDHPAGLLLFDSGFGSHPDVDEHYRINRVELPAALDVIGLSLDDVALIVNCHLHFDHCGGNPLLPGRPVFTQSVELSTARRTPDYTLPELVDFADVRYEELDGETEIIDNVWVIPTPGHTDGHQSLVVRCDDGTIILAGQAVDAASDFTAAALAHHAHRDAGSAGDLPAYQPWIERLVEFDPARVLFAHDNAIWQP